MIRKQVVDPDIPRTDFGDMTPFDADEARTLRALLTPHAGTFVSFQDVDVLEPNASYSNHCTPNGLYAFPLDPVYLGMIEGVENRKEGRMYPFDWFGFSRRPHAFTFDVAGRVLDATYEGFLEDAVSLERACFGTPMAGFTENFVRFHRPGAKDDLRRLFMMTEIYVDTRLGIRAQEGPFRTHPDKPALWRDTFMGLGVKAMVDTQSMLTSDIWRQVVVFDHTALRDVVRHDNPCCINAVSPAP